MKVVLDTDVLVAAFRSPTGASRQLLILLNEDRFEALASVTLVLEYEAVLKRPENLIGAGLNETDIDKFINALVLKIKPVKTFYLWRPMLKDPNDEFVLEVAVNGQADAIVTFNSKDFAGGAKRFGLEILKPAEMLRRVNLWRI